MPLQIRVGAILALDNLKTWQPTIQAGFSPPRGEKFTVLFLGSAQKKTLTEAGYTDEDMHRQFSEAGVRHWPEVTPLSHRELNENQANGEMTRYRVILELEVAAEDPELAAAEVACRVSGRERYRVVDPLTSVAYEVICGEDN